MNVFVKQWKIIFWLPKQLISLVVIPFDGHFSCVILKPYGKYIKNKFKSCKNYLHYNLKSNGNIIEFDDSEDLFKFGIPHNVRY